MRKLWLFIITIFAGTFIICGCKKNMVDERYTPIINPVTPDFTTKVNAAVNGFITDENGEALEGASITGGAITVTTDEFGYFKISNAAFAKSAGFIQITRSGYFTGYRTFLPAEGKETFIRLQLIPKINTGNVDAVAGGTVTTTDGATVTLPANGVVIAANNAAYTGLVNVAAHWLNPSEEQKTQLTMPGDLTGVDSAGHLNVLVTYGMLAVELSGSGGELLQIAPGKKASLHFPIPSSLSGTAPASIPLWYFDESKGVWKQEGRAVKNGNSYDGDVSHFSYWNCDIGYSPVSFTAQIVDSELRPLANTEITITGNQFSSYNHGCTDTSGIIYGMLPANADLAMAVAAPSCNQKISIKNIRTSNNNIDLGTIKVNAQQYSATFKGIANKCNGTPITNGIVLLKQNNISNLIQIQNGTFNSTITICTNSNTEISIVDLETLQQSNTQNIMPLNGLNDLGTLSACVPFTGEYVIYEIDGASILLTLPQHQFNVNYFLLENKTEITVRDLLSGYSVFEMNISGADITGDHTTNTPVGIMTNTATGNYIPYELLNPSSINISEYGLIGQFIKGSYNGTVKNIYDNSMHTLNFTFQVQRDQ